MSSEVASSSTSLHSKFQSSYSLRMKLTKSSSPQKKKSSQTISTAMLSTLRKSSSLSLRLKTSLIPKPSSQGSLLVTSYDQVSSRFLPCSGFKEETQRLTSTTTLNTIRIKFRTTYRSLCGEFIAGKDNYRQDLGTQSRGLRISLR